MSFLLEFYSGLEFSHRPTFMLTYDAAIGQVFRAAAKEDCHTVPNVLPPLFIFLR